MECKECKGRGYVPYRTPDGVYGRTTCMPCKGDGVIKEEKKPRYTKVFK